MSYVIRLLPGMERNELRPCDVYVEAQIVTPFVVRVREHSLGIPAGAVEAKYQRIKY